MHAVAPGGIVATMEARTDVPRSGWLAWGRQEPLPLEMRAARMELARRAETLILVRNGFATAGFTWLLWDVLPRASLLAWLMCAMALFAGRIVSARRVVRSGQGLAGFVEREERSNAVKEVSAGALWIGLAFLCVIHAPQRLEFPYMLFILLTSQIYLGVPFERASAAELILAVAATLVPLAVLVVDPRAPPHGELFAIAVTYALTISAVSCVLQVRASRALSKRLQGLDALAELSRQSEVLKADARAKTSFIASFAHDLRQPLQAAILLSESLAARLSRTDAAAIAEATARCARSMADSITSVLEISRFDAGTLRPKPRPVSVQAILEAVLRQHAAQAGREGTRLEALRTAAVVHTDPELLSRVLDRFVQNALVFARGRRILIGCRRRGTGLRIHVVDNGPGIAREFHATVFNEFCHATAPGLPKAEGPGLGLAVARRIAMALGARVGMASVPGRGSNFHVEVPGEETCCGRAHARVGGLPRRAQLETVDAGFLMNNFGAAIGIFGTLIIAWLAARVLEPAALYLWLAYALATYTMRLVVGALYWRFSRTRYLPSALHYGQNALVYMILVVNNSLAVLGVYLALGPDEGLALCYLIFFFGFIRNGHPRWFVTQMLNSESVYRKPERYLVPLVLHAAIPLLLVVLVRPQAQYAIAALLAVTYVVVTVMIEPGIRAKIAGTLAARQRKLALMNSPGALRGGVETARRELDLQRAILNCANVARRRFVAAASHDFRQPAQAMAMNHAALQARVTDARARELLDKLDACVAAIGRQFDALAETAVEPERLPAQRMRDVCAEDVLARVRAQFVPQAQAMQARLSIRPCRRSVRTDPQLLERILANLVSNALRYGAGRGVVVGCRRRKDHVVFQVIDRGPGIDAARIPEIFREFHQLDPAAGTQGVGLGLAIVERTAQRLRHRLTIASALGGGGTIFSLEVPNGAPITAGAGAPAPGHMSAFAFRRALAIDDDPMGLDALARVLEDWGLVVLRATSAEGAQRAVAEAGVAPDIIVADHNLRGERTGIDAIRALRESNGPIPALLLSGGLPEEAHRQAEDLGCPVLPKPVSSRELNDAIRRLLETARNALQEGAEAA